MFADVQAGRIDAMVTPITVAEVMTGPLRAGKEALAERYRQAITASPGFSVRDTNTDIAVLVSDVLILGTA